MLPQCTIYLLGKKKITLISRNINEGDGKIFLVRQDSKSTAESVVKYMQELDNTLGGAMLFSYTIKSIRHIRGV